MSRNEKNDLPVDECMTLINTWSLVSKTKEGVKQVFIIVVKIAHAELLPYIISTNLNWGRMGSQK